MTAINLTRLRQLRAKMTPGEWELWTSNSQRRLTAHGQQDGGILSAVYHHRQGYADLEGNNRDNDLAGIVATHAAADILIEIAEAALAWRAMIERNLAHLHTLEEQELYRILAKVSKEGM